MIGLDFQGQSWDGGLVARSISAHRLADLLRHAPQPGPAYQGVADGLRLLLLDGELTSGMRLPSERELSRALGLSRTTVAAAYALLQQRGLLSARRGAGNFVTAGTEEIASPLLPAPTVGAEGGVIGLCAASSEAPPGLAAAYASSLTALPGLLSGSGYFPDGLPSLRERLASWYAARGLPTEPDQLVITSGALSALNVVGRALLSPGDRVLVESPTYANAIGALRGAGGRLTGLSLGADGSGWDQAPLDRALTTAAPRMAFLIPDFHNPTGRLVADDDRARVAAALRRRGCVPVVDETLVELNLDGVAMPAPFATHAGSAITLGSASKSFWGGLRLGWIRAPRKLVRPLIQARVSLDLGAAALEQVVLGELLAAGDIVLAGQRARLATRRDHLLAELRQHLPDWTITRPPGGQTLWVGLPGPTARHLVAAAERHRLLLTPGRAFFVGSGGERSLRLPFTAPEDLLTEAVQRLVAAEADVAAGVQGPLPAPLQLTA